MLIFPQFYLMEYCGYHASEAVYPQIQFKNSTLPNGEYPCCKEPVFRFQPIPQVS